MYYKYEYRFFEGEREIDGNILDLGILNFESSLDHDFSQWIGVRFGVFYKYPLTDYGRKDKKLYSYGLLAEFQIYINRTSD